MSKPLLERRLSHCAFGHSHEPHARDKARFALPITLVRGIRLPRGASMTMGGISEDALLAQEACFARAFESGDPSFARDLHQPDVV